MSITRNRFWEALKRSLAPPVFAERDKTMRAEMLHWVILFCLLIALLSLLVGVPFVFQNKAPSAGLVLVLLGATLISWKLCSNGNTERSAVVLLAGLWIVAALNAILAHRVEFASFMPILLMALLFSGPLLALAVAASAVMLFTGIAIALQLGISWPMPFLQPPQALLFQAIVFLALAVVPVAVLARQFRTAIQDFSQFRTAQRDLRIITWIWDITSDQVWWDGDLSPLLGLVPGRYSGTFQDYLTFLDPDDRPLARQRYIDCLKGRSLFYSGEDCITWPDGSRHWLAVSGQGAYAPDGRATRLTGVVMDNTERKTSEAALAHTEERLAVAFNASPDPMVISSVSDGRILDANPAFARLTGYSLEMVRNRTGADVGIWSNPADRAAWFKEMVEHGEVRDKLITFRAKDGADLFGRLSGSMVYVEGEQCIVSIV